MSGFEPSSMPNTSTSIFGQVSYSSSFMHSRVWPDFTDIFDGRENATLLESESDPSLHRQLMYEHLKRKLWKYSHSSLWHTVDDDKCNHLLHNEAGFKTSFLELVKPRRVRTMSILHFAITIMDEWAYQRRLEITSQQHNVFSSSSSSSSPSISICTTPEKKKPSHDTCGERSSMQSSNGEDTLKEEKHQNNATETSKQESHEEWIVVDEQ